MLVFDPLNYTQKLQKHYENYYDAAGSKLNWEQGPKEKLHPNFFVLEIPPNKKQGAYTYCTIGMSLGEVVTNPIELIVYSPIANKSLLLLLTVCASYHRNGAALNLHHTVNIGQSWLNESICDHAFISLPYLEGETLEIFKFGDEEIHCYWLIPITEKERDYKIQNGSEALEQLFEDKQLDYLNPNRGSLI